MWVIANFIKSKNLYSNPEYKYFTYGLMAKVVGAIALGLVYFFYYGGGDTINYYETARAYDNLFFKNQSNFWLGWLGNPTYEAHFWDDETGYSTYRHSDPQAFFVVRLLIPILALSFKSYFACAVLVGALSFTGMWKLYRVFLSEFPQLKKEFAIAILFLPSCVFWGSGMMKDSFTLSAVGWFTYSFYYFFIKKQRKIGFVIYLLISSLIIIAIKPYIFFALLPGSIIWLSNNLINKINNKVFRSVAFPFLITMGLLGGYFALQQLGDNLGQYKLDSVMDRAVLVQQDMKADYYAGKTFDIGNFDASVSGMVKKAPVAIFAGIFRPGLWDVRNAVMAISSLENTYLLFLTVFLLIRLKFIGFFFYIGKNPLILFSILFSLFFAFSVGLTVANFGSLVRLRIPGLPFFLASLFAIKFYYEEGKKNKFKIKPTKMKSGKN